MFKHVSSFLRPIVQSTLSVCRSMRLRGPLCWSHYSRQAPDWASGLGWHCGRIELQRLEFGWTPRAGQKGSLDPYHQVSPVVTYVCARQEYRVESRPFHLLCPCSGSKPGGSTQYRTLGCTGLTVSEIGAGGLAEFQRLHAEGKVRYLGRRWRWTGCCSTRCSRTRTSMSRWRACASRALWS